MRLKDNEPYIIAEIGSNWRKSEDQDENLKIALEQISKAKECGANAVKFQLFTHKEMYGIDGDDKYALPWDWIPNLSAHANELGLDFGCTAFSTHGYSYIDPFVDFHKVASSNVSHLPIQRWFRDYCPSHKTVFVSNGMFHEREFSEPAEQIVVMECVSKYPAGYTITQ